MSNQNIITNNSGIPPPTADSDIYNDTCLEHNSKFCLYCDTCKKIYVSFAWNQKVMKNIIKYIYMNFPTKIFGAYRILKFRHKIMKKMLLEMIWKIILNKGI